MSQLEQESASPIPVQCTLPFLQPNGLVANLNTATAGACAHVMHTAYYWAWFVLVTVTVY
jgi:hypothetical protein